MGARGAIASSFPERKMSAFVSRRAFKPAGEWNTFDFCCEGKKLILKVNGTVPSEFDKCRNLKGYFGLEAEGSRIEFRNMRIKLLK
jgi:hypothetical protein